MKLTDGEIEELLAAANASLDNLRSEHTHSIRAEHYQARNSQIADLENAIMKLRRYHADKARS